MYPEEIVIPMRKDLTQVGIMELQTPKEVDDLLENKGTILLVVNSVCGCAAANARPAVKMSLDSSIKPQYTATVFAGVDKEATNRARSYMMPFPPSSPSIALFKDGELVHMLERHHIEGHSAEDIADNLRAAYLQYCN